MDKSISIRELEKILKALASRRRLAILKYLKEEREASVGEISGEIKVSFKATSKHLAILTAADIVERDQRGLQMFYRIAANPKSVIRVVLSLL